MSRFYPSFNYEYILDLPLKVFTLYNTNMNRIRAEEDMRLFQIMLASDGGDPARSLIRRLEDEHGKPVVVEAAMEPNAMEKLKALSERMNVTR